MGIQQLYNDNLRKLPNEYGDISIMNYSSVTERQKFIMMVKCNFSELWVFFFFFFFFFFVVFFFFFFWFFSRLDT